MDFSFHRSSTYKSDSLGSAVEQHECGEDSECEEANNLNTEEDETEFEEAVNPEVIEKGTSEVIE